MDDDEPITSLFMIFTSGERKNVPELSASLTAVSS